MRISDWSSDVCSSDLYDTSDLKAYALFSQTELSVSEQLTLVAGLSYNHETRDFTVDYSGVPGGTDRKSVVQGKSESVSVDHGGGGNIKKTLTNDRTTHSETNKPKSTDRWTTKV